MTVGGENIGHTGWDLARLAGTGPQRRATGHGGGPSSGCSEGGQMSRACSDEACAHSSGSPIAAPAGPMSWA